METMVQKESSQYCQSILSSAISITSADSRLMVWIFSCKVATLLTVIFYKCMHACISSLVCQNAILYARSLPLNLTAWPYFWSLVISWSPCLTTSLYCLFLSSGLLVSMIPFPVTRSMVQGILSAAMNFARSLGLISKEIHRFSAAVAYRSKKSTETPKSFAILSRPTTR
jgi:hypothetical protein